MNGNSLLLGMSFAVNSVSSLPLEYSILILSIKVEIALTAAATKSMADHSPPTSRRSADLDSFDVGDTKVQHYGLLMKKPFGHKSGRWQKR